MHNVIHYRRAGPGLVGVDLMLMVASTGDRDRGWVRLILLKCCALNIIFYRNIPQAVPLLMASAVL